MLFKGFLSPKQLAIVGLATLTCLGLGLTAERGMSDDTKQDQAVDQPAEKGAAKPEKKSDAPGADKSETESKKGEAETPKAEPQAPLPEVILLPDLAAKGDDSPEKPIVEAIREFAKTFNSHDPKALTALFTSQAELIDQAGQTTRGDAAILATFTKLFSDHPSVKIRFEVKSIRYLNGNLAIEDGSSIMTSDAADPAAADQDRYTVTHVLQDGKWLIASAQDWPAAPPTREEELKQLEWLVGDWVDENGDALVATKYHWSDDKSYLLCDYSIHRQGEKPRKGTQRIGWDARAQKLRSWNFDTAGGFSEALWTRAGNQWLMKINGVTADGKTRSSTNVLTRLSQDHATMQSKDRIIGGELLPDRPEMPIVRKAPEPSRSAKE